MQSVPTLQIIIDKTFKKELNEFQNSGKELEVGQAVLAKMSGYCPWPARIEGFTKNKLRMQCYFYGAMNRGTIDVSKTIPFENAFEIIRLINLRNTKDFAKGVKELEIEQGVPAELSSLKEMESLR